MAGILDDLYGGTGTSTGDLFSGISTGYRDQALAAQNAFDAAKGGSSGFMTGGGILGGGGEGGGNWLQGILGGGNGENGGLAGGIFGNSGVLGSLANLGNLFMMWKSLGLAEDQLDFSKEAFQKNYDAKATAYNERMRQKAAARGMDPHAAEFKQAGLMDYKKIQ
jgi:hypothetical protein